MNNNKKLKEKKLVSIKFYHLFKKVKTKQNKKQSNCMRSRQNLTPLSIFSYHYTIITFDIPIF